MKATFSMCGALLASLALSHQSISSPGAGLTLDQALQIARENNPAIVSATSQVSAAKAGVSSARAALSPQLSANSFATSGSYNTIFGSSPGVMPPYSLTTPPTSFADQNVMLMVPLFTGGRLQALVRAASSEQLVAQGATAETVADALLKVEDAYLRSLVAKQMTAVQQSKVAAAEELLRTTEAEAEVGKGIEASVLRVQAELAKSQRALTSAKNDEAKAKLDLQVAMGVNPGAPIELADDLALSSVSEPLEFYLSQSSLQRGSVLASKAKVDAANARVRAAQGQRAPQLYGQAMADAASQRDGTGRSVGLTLSLPLFDGGRITADVEQARAGAAMARAELKQTELNIENEVRQAWLDVLTAQTNADSAEASVRGAQAAYDVIALRVSAGKAILVEQLDALQSLTEAKGDLAQATYEHQIAKARLERASGGLK